MMPPSFIMTGSTPAVVSAAAHVTLKDGVHVHESGNELMQLDKQSVFCVLLHVGSMVPVGGGGAGVVVGAAGAGVVVVVALGAQTTRNAGAH